MAANLRYIFRFMLRASDSGADIIHFPESALPGLVHVDFPSFSGFDWSSLARHTGRILDYAAELNIWVVLGSCRTVTDSDKPKNCLYIISSTGAVAATYDKRELYGKEVEVFSPGERPVIQTINGIKCGFLVCFDSCFPALYASYRNNGVQLLFHSYYNARNDGAANSLDDLILAQLRTRAADHRMWISASNSSARHSRLSTCIVRPDGSVVGTKKHVAGMVFHDLPDRNLGWTYDNHSYLLKE